MPAPLPDAIVDRIRELRHEGRTIAWIANELEVSIPSVQRYSSPSTGDDASEPGEIDKPQPDPAEPETPTVLVELNEDQITIIRRAIAYACSIDWESHSDALRAALDMEAT